MCPNEQLSSWLRFNIEVCFEICLTVVNGGASGLAFQLDPSWDQSWSPSWDQVGLPWITLLATLVANPVQVDGSAIQVGSDCHGGHCIMISHWEWVSLWSWCLQHGMILFILVLVILVTLGKKKCISNSTAMFLESASSRCDLQLVSLVFFFSSLLRLSWCQWRFPSFSVCYLPSWWFCVNCIN